MPSTERKWVLSRQLALVCCRDLLPFNIVEKSGFVTFLLQNKVVSEEDEIPASTTLARTAVITVYDKTAAKVKEVIQQSPRTVAVITDMWIDNYKRRSYMTVTLHFCSLQFRLHSLVLRTAVFSKSHTSVNI